MPNADLGMRKELDSRFLRLVRRCSPQVAAIARGKSTIYQSSVIFFLPVRISSFSGFRRFRLTS